MSGRSFESRVRRKRDVKARISSDLDNHLFRCTIWMDNGVCGRPTERAARTGLSKALCAAHARHKAAHGSPHCKSPRATETRNYIRTALAFIAERRTNPFVSAAIRELSILLDSAGPKILPTRLKGLSADRRARAALARLREQNVQPERLLAIVLGISCFMAEAPEAVHRVKSVIRPAILPP